MNTATCSYVDTSKQDGDPDHIKVFANADAAEAWRASPSDMKCSKCPDCALRI